MSSLCLALSLRGTITSKWTNWWPGWRAPEAWIPRRVMTRRSPVCVPAGTLRDTSPSSVGMTTDEPSRASVSASRTFTWISVPSRSKMGCSATATWMKSEPRPPGPSSPCPLIRRFMPESTPAGMSTSRFRCPSVGERQLTVRRQPLAACIRSSCMPTWTSRPRAGPRCRPPWPNALSKASKISSGLMRCPSWKPPKPPPGNPPPGNPPPGKPPAPPPSTPALPNWSYALRFPSSESTSYASVSWANFLAAAGSPAFVSGWHFFASL
mmetsp:Transcript_6602/g.17127  ORF Transcript_6602/g.17127 Transcript_6602/m.17127 type:complete len:267 (+) Transcript_6602:347-1147(+)